MLTLAVDIGGTRFTLAVFDGDRMVRREQRSTKSMVRPLLRTAEFGNLVTRVTVGKPGTATASPAEVLEAARC